MSTLIKKIADRYFKGYSVDVIDPEYIIVTLSDNSFISVTNHFGLVVEHHIDFNTVNERHIDTSGNEALEYLERTFK